MDNVYFGAFVDFSGVDIDGTDWGFYPCALWCCPSNIDPKVSVIALNVGKEEPVNIIAVPNSQIILSEFQMIVYLKLRQDYLVNYIFPLIG